MSLNFLNPLLTVTLISLFFSDDVEVKCLNKFTGLKRLLDVVDLIRCILAWE